MISHSDSCEITHTAGGSGSGGGGQGRAAAAVGALAAALAKAERELAGAVSTVEYMQVRLCNCLPLPCDEQARQPLKYLAGTVSSVK